MRRLQFATIIGTLALAACAPKPPPPVTLYKTVEVVVTKDAPCPKNKATIPAQPRRVHDEHPAMPPTAEERERILAGKLLEWQTYGERANGVMQACSEPQK